MILSYSALLFDKLRELEFEVSKIQQDYQSSDCATLCAQVKHLDSQYKTLQSMLPQHLRLNEHLERHLWWLLKRLSEGAKGEDDGNLNDLVSNDFPNLNAKVKNWCLDLNHHTATVRSRIPDQFYRHEYSSTIREMFTLLAEKIRQLASLPDTLDGHKLYDEAFGDKATNALATKMNNSERVAMRSLCKGLFGVFRNPHAHTSSDPMWFEAQAIVGMIGLILNDLDNYYHK